MFFFMISNYFAIFVRVFQFSDVFFFTLFRTCTAERIRAVAKSHKYRNKNENLVFSFFFAEFQLFCIFFKVFQLFYAFNTFQKMHSWEDPSLPSIFWKVFKNIWKLEHPKRKLESNWKTFEKNKTLLFLLLLCSF